MKFLFNVFCICVRYIASLYKERRRAKGKGEGNKMESGALVPLVCVCV